MPTAGEHLEKARCAEELAFRLNGSVERERDWIITLMFYAAVHCVEAYFAGCNPPVHSRNHNERKLQIDQNVQLRTMANAYRDLENFSTIARYRYWSFSDQDLNEAFQALRQIQARCR
ncbi:MAG: hypothetical protein IT170_04110 [Bryobacterales bacterium]|nr:hypothetical protein [Bryobacterales bacterium]